MRIGIRPTVDVVFKKIFGSPEHSHLTLSFLNSLLPLVGAPRAERIEIVNPFRLAEFSGDKEIAVDVHARDQNGRDFQVEMQVRPSPSLPERMLDNWARLFSAQIHHGEEYDSHKPVISIWILKRSCFNDSPWLHTFRAYDADHKTALGESLIVATVELGKRAALPDFGEEAIFREGIDEWLYLLARGDEIDPEGDRYGEVEGGIREAVEIMSTFTKSQKARYTYDRRLEYERVMAEWKRESEEAGRAEGFAQGLEEGRTEGRTEGRSEGRAEGRAEGSHERALEDARRLKELGLDLDSIAKGTGLSREDVEGL